MERRHASPFWRASLGVVVTAVAAGLLAIAVGRVFWLNSAAGNTISELARERTAIAYQQRLFVLLEDVERFRLGTQLRRAPPDPGAADAVDGQMAVVGDFAAARAASLDVSADWAAIERQWTQIRRHPRVSNGEALSRLARALSMLVYKIEDTSGIQYESKRHAQDLGDLLFAKMPEAVYDAAYANLIGENAQAAGGISIPNRVRLAGLLNLLRGDIDLESDNWERYASDKGRHDGAAFVADGNRLVADLNARVLMRPLPGGDAAETGRLARRTIAAAAVLNRDAATLLDTRIAVRMGYEATRNRYIYGIVLLSAVLLVGMMLLVAEFTARRDRQALRHAQQESARLGAELARQTAERALRLSEARFRTVFDGAALGIAVLDREGEILDANDVFRAVYGECSRGLLQGRDDEFAELMRAERALFEFEHHVLTPSGNDAWTACTLSLVKDDAGRPHLAICTFRDLTELRRSERRMQHDMTHDALTGLPNRGLFETKLREQFARAKTSAESSFAVLTIDLDRFKDINESLGHQAGDFVIGQVGQRLRAVIESTDAIARLGSDEFAVLIRSLTDVLHVELIARRILGALSKPVLVGNRSIFVSASVGIAIASASYRRGEDILRDADIAMHYAKGLGGRFAIFDSHMHARAEKRLQLTTDLRLALERGEFALLYQPIVDISNGSLVGCEALLRWNHPTEGIMLPSEFMPLAEQTGLAAPIGRFVVRGVCGQIVQWKRMARAALFPVNVNVSAAELLEPEFESVALEAVREFGVDPNEITLEITESVVLDAGTRPNTLVERLREHGFRICIDDFGTGYSSLRYLQQFKVDTIKIDRSFVCGHDGEVASEPIVRTLMTLAEAFDVRVVAEGIETGRQRDVLRSAGCRFGQGFYYARALGADELTAMYPTVFGLAPKHVSA